MNHAVRMYEYHAWATQVLLGRIKELPELVWNQPVNSSFPAVAHAFAHLYAVDKMWFMVLQGAGMPEALEACTPVQEESVAWSVDAFVDAFARLAEQYGQWFRAQSDLEQSLTLDNPYAGIRSVRHSDIALHVANHGTYHRGNVSTMLRQLGHASAMNDYALFWYQSPAEVGSSA
ncbi:DinB family protein [Paenibacillus sp. TRM 82003]|nr:DinB family protein [Paenibacillus sp. TRM 82003]